MGVNRTPGQTASGFRMYVDKSKTDSVNKPATREEVVIGAIFNHGGIEYTVKKIDKDSIKLEGMNGLAVRSTIVDISELTKSGSNYELHRDKDV